MCLLANTGWVYVVATRLDGGEKLIITTVRQPKKALANYRLHWSIEILFATLKTGALL
ncbi:MAG: hypothetical protein AAGD09_11390 [Cyanobacteria bacterium P01_F01_bin.56]